MMSMDKLRTALATIEVGDMPEAADLDRLLAACWDTFDGSGEGGMELYKLLRRMEQVRWEPPILRFVVERHGGTVCGSTRAELQHWEVDLDNRTARIVKTDHRQLTPMAARVSIKALAEEIIEAILSGHEDDRIRRSDDGSVKVLASRIFPTGSGFKRTVEGRRKRLLEHLVQMLESQGWTRSGPANFATPQESESLRRSSGQQRITATDKEGIQR